LFQDITLGRVVSYVGFAVGCAFITYMIRTMGYFSIIAPEYLGFFVETDLIMGAIRATPFVVGMAWLIYTMYWIVGMAHDELHRVPQWFTSPFEKVRAASPSWLFPTIICLVLGGSQLLPENDNYILRVMVACIAAFFMSLSLIEQFQEYGTVNPITALATLFLLHAALFDEGKWEAISDLRHSKARYSITTSDKSYANVLLLRASSSSVLLKVGGDVVLYERSQVVRIERSADAPASPTPAETVKPPGA
jgi:hypothetical protein